MIRRAQAYHDWIKSQTKLACYIHFVVWRFAFYHDEMFEVRTKEGIPNLVNYSIVWILASWKLSISCMIHMNLTNWRRTFWKDSTFLEIGHWLVFWIWISLTYFSKGSNWINQFLQLPFWHTKILKSNSYCIYEKGKQKVKVDHDNNSSFFTEIDVLQ